MFESILDPIFSPILKLPSFWAVFLISILVSLLVILIYKYTTDQKLMKQLKDDLKTYQKQMKELRSNPQKMMEVQKKAMQVNMKYMSKSLKSTLITFIPIIIIFSWMNAHFAFDPIKPNQDFTTTSVFEEGTSGTIELIAPDGVKIKDGPVKEVQNNKAVWALEGSGGTYHLEYKFANISYFQEVLITNEYLYKTPITPVQDSKLKTLQIDNKKKIVLNLFGWKLGWLGSYIILSIIFSILLRKAMKVY